MKMFLFAVMVLHGGPGGASQEVYRQYFDPKAYRVIQIDQRGCGRSTPHAELQENNTQVASLKSLLLTKLAHSNVVLHSSFFYKQFFYKHWGSNSQKIKQFLSICWGWSWSKNKHWVKQSEARQNLSIGKHFEPGERSIDGPNFSFLYAPNRY